MNDAAQNPNTVFRTEDDLLHLQLRIAQRADELARGRQIERSPGHDWECWLAAERDVMARCHEPEMAHAP